MMTRFDGRRKPALRSKPSSSWMPASKAVGRKYRALPLLLAALALPLQAQKFYTYVTDLGPDYVELSWGTTTGANTIGRSSPSHGEATVLIAGKTLLSRGNSIIVGNLAPDHDYTYKVTIRSNVA